MSLNHQIPQVKSWNIPVEYTRYECKIDTEGVHGDKFNQVISHNMYIDPSVLGHPRVHCECHFSQKIIQVYLYASLIFKKYQNSHGINYVDKKNRVFCDSRISGTSSISG